ncbi:MAG TPA: GspMb/PilO family protein [Acidobacteriaceae bacterium]|jgi:Tfp pilus assembly protein PilO|nr:GspMb/PilO family protein [Acidobacteriaceae bacterium]
MSATAVAPPPSSSSLLRRGPRLTARARALLTAVNLHYAGVAALLVVVLYIAAHLLFVSESLHANNADALEGQRARLTTAQLQAKPLRGLDAKLTESTADADAFYAQRLPYAYSQVLAELGALTQKANVRLMNVQYAQSPVLSGTYALTEVRMDASVAGDYRPIVEFINSLERDRMFFLVNGINLTGQQNGMVNLRIRLTTYLRVANAEEEAAQLTAAGAAHASGGTP